MTRLPKKVTFEGSGKDTRFGGTPANQAQGSRPWLGHRLVPTRSQLSSDPSSRKPSPTSPKPRSLPPQDPRITPLFPAWWLDYNRPPAGLNAPRVRGQPAQLGPLPDPYSLGLGLSECCLRLTLGDRKARRREISFLARGKVQR